MFEMFYKGSNESQGAGLGLYIVQGVIKKLNGKISFKTSMEGTTFTVEIPNVHLA
jgi:signal transduction histidine kinase